VHPLDPVIGEIVCGSFALLFGSACAHKLRDLETFGATLAQYRVLPGSLVSPAALLLPILEGLIAVGLLIGSIREPASLVGAALLATYAAAMGLNLLRGRRQLECGCLGPRGGGVVSASLVCRNVLMALILAAAGSVSWSGRPLIWLDVGTALVAVSVVALLYLAANGLLAVAARHPPLRG
jgi:hypothetical protein